MLSSSELSRLSCLLSGAHRERKVASEKELNAWNYLQVVKMDNETQIELLESSSKSNSHVQKIIKEISIETSKAEIVYKKSTNELERLNTKCDRLKNQIVETKRRQTIARNAGVEERYIDFISISERIYFGIKILNIYFNDDKDIFKREDHGHYAYFNGIRIYEREIGEPHGEQNFLNSCRHFSRNMTAS